jgi:hypothetical protein
MNYRDYNKELYKTEYHIDKENHPDNEIINFCGKQLKLGDIRKLYETFEEQKYNMISFWDDMFQYTSLGLLDIIFDIYHINSPIPSKSFFNRNVVYGREFVYNTVKHFNISTEEVNEIEKKYYEEVLMRSPVSDNAIGFLKLRNICKSHLLVLKYPLDNIDTITRNLQETFGKDEYISLEVDYRQDKTEQEYLKTLSKSRESYFDIVICQDAAAIIEYLVEHGIKGSQILTPLNHNGLSLEAQYTFEELLEGVGPNSCRLHYIKEKI